jgi:hypothetical protein
MDRQIDAMDGWKDGWVDGWLDGWTDRCNGWMEGWVAGWMDGQMPHRHAETDLGPQRCWRISLIKKAVLSRTGTWDSPVDTDVIHAQPRRRVWGWGQGLVGGINNSPIEWRWRRSIAEPSTEAGPPQVGGHLAADPCGSATPGTCFLLGRVSASISDEAPNMSDDIFFPSVCSSVADYFSFGNSLTTPPLHIIVL